MKVKLFDFQKDALQDLRERLVAARNFASEKNPQAVSFSAPTGSGKTIIMTALFEAILDQPDDQLEWPLDWAPQEDAIILWVSDMPELNEQTRLKIESKSEKVYRVNQLITIDAHFDAPILNGGKIYFINTQKLAKNQPLTNPGDERQHLIWETFTNTAKAFPDRFYVVIDEAHRGMTTNSRAAQTAQTIMQRFLLGHKAVGLVPMPLVVGVSATPKRFTDLMEQAPHTLHKVIVPAEEVRKSGLLKDRVLIHHPELKTKAEMALLEEAARKWRDMSQAWQNFCKEEREQTIWPVLVVQIENGTESQLTKTDLGDALSVIEKAIDRRLNEGEIAHAMHDAGDLDVGGRRVRRVDASKIDADKGIGVVFFKTSLSTGWDCPRAEVMMSFRKAEDHTYIAQLLGRMVRTPLARRIEKDASLNDVHLFLPHFDEVAVNTVIESLKNTEEVPPSETGSSRELIVLNRHSDSEVIFDALANLPVYRVNAARAQSSLRRFFALSRLLTIDDIDEYSWQNAKNEIVQWMVDEIAILSNTGQLSEAAKSISHVGLRTLALNHGTGIAKPEAEYQVEASSVDIDRLFEEAGRIFSNGLQMEYWRASANSDRPAREVKVEIILLARNAAAITSLERKSEAAFDALFDKHKRAIKQLKENQRIKYENLRLATAIPKEIEWQLPDSIAFVKSEKEKVWERHLYVDDNNEFKTVLGTWEAEVLQEELSKVSVVAWLRNLPRKPWALEIPYETGGAIRPMFPDLVVIRNEGEELVVDILEPHDPSLADNFEKAKGLAQFAEKHGDDFGRIQLIRKKGEHYQRLDINKISTIKKLLLITSNPQLDQIFSELAD
ncbi:DEAD/DEAH box helicase family protein [Vibrio vulnificus]|uniref:DEAD/DEAH box helicase family protein n=1 Tax=Vibrio vulnificus TaxID=672 RepID=UPI0028C76AA4|nr:DEAD/DEAH box helicase family protein [Vibrio vulnificus]